MTEVSSFWARRKAAVAAEEEAEVQAVREAAREEALAEQDDAEILEEMGLPDPVAMKKGDDFAAFMGGDVPEHLRLQALRTLWRSDPVLACVDGLVEYGDDYRAAMLLDEPIKTAYQVGKGMKAHIDEMARQAEDKAKVAETPEGEEAEEPDLVAEEPVLLAEDETVDETLDEVVEPQEVALAEEEYEAIAPRRMRFRFEGAAT